jgi:hypothetical protein
MVSRAARLLAGLAAVAFTAPAWCVAAAAAADAAMDAAPSEAPPCRTEVALDPERAFVGQEVIWRLRILRHESVSSVRWIQPPSFPSIRSEWLPDRTPDPAIHGIGAGYLVFEERRALFPVLAGSLAIPPARIGCESDGGVFEVEVPGSRLEAEPLPADGRPEDFTGLVGRIRVDARAESDRVALGGSLRATVTIEGAAPLWDAAAPWDPVRLHPGLDLYARPPDLHLVADDRLVVRRRFAYDVVPRHAGRFVLPGVRIPWFDPESRRYEVSEAAPVVFEATAAPPPTGPPGPEPSPPPPAAGAAGRPRGWLGVGIGLVIAAGGAALWLRRRRRRAPARAARPALAEAARALALGEQEAAGRALAAALRAGLAARVPGALSLSAEELAEQRPDAPAVAEAAELLGGLDRARFGRDAAPALPSLERVRAVLERL